MTTENQIEQSLINKLIDLKYTYRQDIRDRGALEANFREKFEALNRVHLTDAEFARLRDEIVTADVFSAAQALREKGKFNREDGTPLEYMLVNLRDWCKNDFEVINSETYGELIDKVTGGIALVLVVLSSIGLLVGGIGVMNIMLISVAERTREIGVRMAVGARRQDVLLQVLVEAATLTGIGGVLGIGLGYLASWGMTHVLRFPFEVSPLVTIGAALFAVAIGVFFGLYPANKAARLDPIVALGRE